MKKIIIGLSLIFIGCGSNIIYFPENEPKLVEEDFYGFISPSNDIRYFRASVNFSDEERDRIVEYLHLLSQKTGQYIGIVFNRPVEPGDCQGEFSVEIRKEIFRTCGTDGGTWQSGSRVIRVATLDVNMTALIVAHEVGHDLGMEHVKATKEGSLMQPKLNYSDHFVWSEYDQAECVRIELCK